MVLLIQWFGPKQYLGVAQVLLPTVVMLPSGSLQVFCDCFLVNEVGLKQYLRVARVLLLTVMMLSSGSLQVFCDCFLVNEVGLKQYHRVAQCYSNGDDAALWKIAGLLRLPPCQ